MRIFVAALTCWSLAGLAAAEPPVGKRGVRTQMDFPPHPGTIRMVDLSTGTTKDVVAEGAPERSRYVYLDRLGRETSDPAEAVERIPIVLVEMMPMDRGGNLVPRDQAAVVRIKEFGPDRRPLRSTTLTREAK